MESDHVPLSYQESVLPMNYTPGKVLVTSVFHCTIATHYASIRVNKREARAGIEPAHRSFADSRVTSSPTRHNQASLLYHLAMEVFYAVL